MTHIVASLVERGVAGVSDSSRVAFREGADLVEIRLDHIEGLTVPMIREARLAAQGPAIATLRSKAEGGQSGLGREQRERLIGAAIEADFEYVDLELKTDARLLKKLQGAEKFSKIIVSTHFPRPAKKEAVGKALEDGWRLGDVAKVAMPCEDAPDALMLAQVGMGLRRRRKRYVLIGMGPQGQLTRALAESIGSDMVYACLPGKQAAPGQLDVHRQSTLAAGGSAILGLIGHPVSHSVSRPMQEAALKDLNIPGIYLPLDFPGKSFDKKTLNLLRDLGFKGLNVTIPHKGAAFRMCSRRSDAALATKAVNTIRFDGKAIVGENTDVTGFAMLLDGKICITRYTNALMVGAGGAARAVAYVLSERRAKITVADIENKRAAELAKAFGARAVRVKKLWKSKDSFDLVVNCTPVGMKGNAGNPIRASFIKPGGIFIDIIFNPLVTEAMETAERHGAKAYSGLEMLVQQGAESFRHWIGKEPNVDAMREAARRALL